MKAILKFDLEDAEDQMAHMRCIKSVDMAIVLFEVQNNLRRGFEESDQLEEFYQKFSDLMDDNNINLNDLIR